MQSATMFGALAAVASMSSFAPQVVRIIKTRKTDDLATPTWLLSAIAFTLWTTYGIILGEWPIIVTNATCLLFASFILVMKLVPRHKKEAIADALDPSIPRTPEP